MTQTLPDQTTKNPEPRLLLHVLPKTDNKTWMTTKPDKIKRGRRRNKTKTKGTTPMITSVQTDNLILAFLSATSIQMFAIKLSLKHKIDRNFQ